MQPLRVLVVDDSLTTRCLLETLLDQEEDLDVVGTANNGVSALNAVRTLKPDVVLLDLDMPVMDGLSALKVLTKDHPDVAVILFSGHTTEGAEVTVEALGLGAFDFVFKPGGDQSLAGRDSVLEELLGKVRATRALEPRRTPEPSDPDSLPALSSARVVVIGVSTGGPKALAELLPKLPDDYPLPVLIVQHMPEMFTRIIAERLDSHCALTVREATDGMQVEAGTILIAPGNHHLRVRGSLSAAYATLDQGPKENSCRPAVDPLFRSVASVYGAGVIGVVLTGMGSDGVDGCRQIHAAGGRVLVQNRESSVVWGMPGAVHSAGLADSVLSLEAIAATLLEAASTAAS